jgi:hypothetical protein
VTTDLKKMISQRMHTIINYTTFNAQRVIQGNLLLYMQLGPPSPPNISDQHPPPSENKGIKYVKSENNDSLKAVGPLSGRGGRASASL